ncbi:8-amino-7-oxononanoate synthase [Frankia casuarinae]|uniref:8-amino-7-oxononanoate synthase n=1 Tax=Frankia casuarinae (strain DSM 45818 / CECT 9043 / HFP020203 / CcI3) TaxID=106370 RepID=Q2J6I0_FRACC|nr:8-amino-7-oxononanoate synthase [Frankia casuarinae]ETA00492.1 8-amino-7-oxononanoate synthase [Frankia sp. CcI6]KDA41825.1 8-amino-7-oxononanoate synthase [Frankia sp. BMG5.23]KEZ35382.1 8-amino-7-oxononanoate synthase [Frankia sp. CeD]KFB06271.1 8-amino-7-oxononanoate synthase [Frankia sp. Allo2]
MADTRTLAVVTVDDVEAAAPLAWLTDHARARAAAGLRRELRPRGGPDKPGASVLVDLAGNDYLGLGRHPAVVGGGIRALRAWGAGATGSRLMTGTTTLHGELENALAAHAGFASALVFSSGYTANLAVVTALAGPGDLVVSDALNHASIVDACRLSRADVVVTPHADVAAVAAALAGRPWRRALVVTESVFSADGDLAPLTELHEAARAHGAVLVVDEAHALGVVGPAGRGALAATGLAGEPDVVATATLSKALGGQGGAVLGEAAVRDHLIDTARSFIFDTGLAPANVGSALAALEFLGAHPELPGTVRRRARQLAGLTGAPDPAGAVVSVIIGDPEPAIAAATTCRGHGVAVGCFRPPTVPVGTSRLRLAARADLTDADLAIVTNALAAAGVLAR